MDKIMGLEYGADDYVTKPFQHPGSKKHASKQSCAVPKKGAKQTEEQKS